VFDLVNTDSTCLIQLDNDQARIPWKHKVWDLLCAAYKDVAGGLHFDSVDTMFNETQTWEVLHDQGQVLAILLYK
jgi:hypothetical protein